MKSSIKVEKAMLRKLRAHLVTGACATGLYLQNRKKCVELRCYARTHGGRTILIMRFEEATGAEGGAA